MAENKKGYEKLTELLTDGRYLFLSVNGEPCYIPIGLAEALLQFYFPRAKDSVDLELGYLSWKLKVLVDSNRLEETKTRLAEMEIQVIEEREGKEAEKKKKEIA